MVDDDNNTQRQQVKYSVYYLCSILERQLVFQKKRRVFWRENSPELNRCHVQNEYRKISTSTVYSFLFFFFLHQKLLF